MLVYTTDKKVQAGIEDAREGVCGWDHDEVLCWEPAVASLWDECRASTCGRATWEWMKCENGLHVVAPAGFCKTHQRNFLKNPLNIREWWE
tara:strand:- start:201 stop:473 length:273 start_codon:yes stop_codon:yes gene_type:complete